MHYLKREGVVRDELQTDFALCLCDGEYYPKIGVTKHPSMWTRDSMRERA
jgi:hypothetical protein